MTSCRSTPPIDIEQEKFNSRAEAVSPPPTPLPKTCILPSRRRRLGRRRAAALHPTRPRPVKPKPRPLRSRRPVAAKVPSVPGQFRDTGAPRHVLERCALPGCTAPPRFAGVDALHCSDAHQLKEWWLDRGGSGARRPAEEQGRGAYVSVVDRRVVADRTAPLSCERCGGRIERPRVSGGGGRRWCERECLAAAYERLRPRPSPGDPRQCARCGGELPADANPRQVYCSGACKCAHSVCAATPREAWSWWWWWW